MLSLAFLGKSKVQRLIPENQRVGALGIVRGMEKTKKYEIYMISVRKRKEKSNI